MFPTITGRAIRMVTGNLMDAALESIHRADSSIGLDPRGL
jgi:hypothetical protein